MRIDQGVISHKLLGMKYNMDDRKKAMEEAQAKVKEAKQALEKLL
jgi:hypothetical protein